MNAADQIKAACGSFVGIAERGQTALACLTQAGIAPEQALPIVAAQLAGEVNGNVSKIKAYWRTACHSMSGDEADRLSRQQEIVARLQALVGAPLHPVMAMAVSPFVTHS